MMDVFPHRQPDAPVNVHALRAPSGGANPSRTGDRAALLTLLRGHRVPDAIAHHLARTASLSGLDQPALSLASALGGSMKPAPLDLAAAKALLLAGPYGAGKTSVAGKIAATARVASRPARLFSFNPGLPGEAARLEGIARETETPFAIVESAQMLSRVVAGCVKKGTLAIIDTAGFDPRCGRARAAFAALSQIEHVETLGVISASTDAEEVCEIAASLASMGAQRLVITGLDMTARLGALVAAACSPLPLAQIACSPQACAGLETATPLSLARALLGGDAGMGGPQ